jgi:transcriptional regulator with XRE-family HTH domain
MNTMKQLRREVLHLTQAQLAELTGVTQATVSRWENGDLSPSLDELRRIKAKYGRKVKLCRLLDGDDHDLPVLKAKKRVAS